MSLLDELRKGIRKVEREALALRGRVLVFGPGDEVGIRKRRNLIRRLRRHGFEAWTSEQLSKKVPSSLNAVRQEEEHWKLCDIVLVVDFAAGPAFELARYGVDPEFRSRAFVVYLDKWDPAVSRSFGTQILRSFPYRERATQAEYDQCLVADRCLEFAINRRQMEAERQRLRSGPTAATS